MFIMLVTNEPRVPRGETFLRDRDVSAKVKLARSTIFDLVKKGKFPQPLKLGALRSTRWRERESDVEKWMSDPANFA
jgi:predicted DNA-binding transcriptional regulator AlpA